VRCPAGRLHPPLNAWPEEDSGAPRPLAVPLDHPRCRPLRPWSSGDPGEPSLASDDSMRRPATTTARLRVRRRAWGRERIPHFATSSRARIGHTALLTALLRHVEFGSQNCWLPGSERTRTSRPALNVPVFIAPRASDNSPSALPRFRYAFDPAALLPKPKPLPAPRETPSQRAQRYQAMIDTGLVSNRAELARALGCSRAWVTKVLGPRSQRSARRQPTYRSATTRAARCPTPVR
jgi:hypothetical protein